MTMLRQGVDGWPMLAPDDNINIAVEPATHEAVTDSGATVTTSLPVCVCLRAVAM